MTKGRQVYVITSGRHDDYRINAIFSTPDAARQYMRALLRINDDYGLEEWTLDDMRPSPGMLRWRVEILRCGTVVEAIPEPSPDYPPDYEGPTDRYLRLPYGKRKMSVVVTCCAPTREAAIEIAKQQLAASISAGEWEGYPT